MAEAGKSGVAASSSSLNRATTARTWTPQESQLLLGLYNSMGGDIPALKKFFPYREHEELEQHIREIFTHLHHMRLAMMGGPPGHPAGHPQFFVPGAAIQRGHPSVSGIKQAGFVPMATNVVRRGSGDIADPSASVPAAFVSHPGVLNRPNPSSGHHITHPTGAIPVHRFPPMTAVTPTGVRPFPVSIPQQNTAVLPPRSSNNRGAAESKEKATNKRGNESESSRSVDSKTSADDGTLSAATSLSTTSSLSSSASQSSARSSSATSTPRKHNKSTKKKSKEKSRTQEKSNKKEWVQCDRCKKWRSLPASISASSLPDRWYCEMTAQWPRRRRLSCETPGRKASRKRGRDTPGIGSEKKKKKKVQKEEWVQCDTCKTWRKLAPSVKPSSLPDKWECAMNYWDRTRASCSAPQEIVSSPTNESGQTRAVTQSDLDAHRSVFHTAEGRAKGKKTAGKLSYRELIPAHHKMNCTQRSGKSRKSGIGLALYWWMIGSSHFNPRPASVPHDKAIATDGAMRLLRHRRIDQMRRAFVRGSSSNDDDKAAPPERFILDAFATVLCRPPELEMVKLAADDRSELRSIVGKKELYLRSCAALKVRARASKEESEMTERLLQRLARQNLPAPRVWESAPALEPLLGKLVKQGLVEEIRDENDCLLEYALASAASCPTVSDVPVRKVSVQLPLKASKPWRVSSKDSNSDEDSTSSEG